ncbi:MAG: hypothetical protein HC893_08445 [Chloroflexaceae bacterium]|nr:hypothetical protein [Chloroflexaceae bacterium]
MARALAEVGITDGDRLVLPRVARYIAEVQPATPAAPAAETMPEDGTTQT